MTDPNKQETTAVAVARKNRPRTITITLTYADLSTIRGWGNYVRFDDEREWDDEDRRVDTLLYAAINPFLAPSLADKLDAP